MPIDIDLEKLKLTRHVLDVVASYKKAIKSGQECSEPENQRDINELAERTVVVRGELNEPSQSIIHIDKNSETLPQEELVKISKSRRRNSDISILFACLSALALFSDLYLTGYQNYEWIYSITCISFVLNSNLVTFRKSSN